MVCRVLEAVLRNLLWILAWRSKQILASICTFGRSNAVAVHPCQMFGTNVRMFA
jgi:hypothetical protein